jgi:fructose-1,6-bisphosphatase
LHSSQRNHRLIAFHRFIASRPRGNLGAAFLGLKKSLRKRLHTPLKHGILLTMEIKLNETSIQTLNALNKIDLTFEEGELARDIDHAAFIAKSEQGLPQLSTAIDFIEFKGMLLAIANKDQAIISVMFQKVDGGFKPLYLSNQSYAAMEMAA